MEADTGRQLIATARFDDEPLSEEEGAILRSEEWFAKTVAPVFRWKRF